MRKILLDTDIGSDIDDAICLAYLLANPECDLLGITTVSGQPDKRAMLADVLCKAAGKKIPIRSGSADPMLTEQLQPDAPQAEALGNWPHEANFPAFEAVDFLRRTIRSHPGEITLLSIGPLTNLGLLFALDPEIPSMLRALVMMCGVFTRAAPNLPLREWNAFCDPYATAIVYRARPAVHRSVGLDVTTLVTMDAAEVRKRFGSGLLKPVLDFAEVWFRNHPVITFHDPLAAAAVFDDSICSFERGTVKVELASRELMGMTHWTPAGREAAAPHEIASRVVPGRFFDHYFSMLSNFR